MEPVAFLRSTPPFDSLPQRDFDLAASSLEIVYHPAGAQILRSGGEPSQHLYVIRKGAVRLERDGETVQLLEEGEIFGFTSLLTGRASLDVRVEDDLLAYRLPAEVFRRLLSHAGFAGQLAANLGERLRYSLERAQGASFQADLSQPVGRLVRRPPVYVPEGATVGEAARVMRDAGISSVLVASEPAGIVTDADLRSRVLAEGLGPDTSVKSVLTRPLRTVEGETPIYEAWQVVLEGSQHHLPVTRGGEIVGVVTSTDLLRHTARGPVGVMKRVERLPDRGALPGYAGLVTEMASSLLAGGLECLVISGFVARLNDTLVSRILRWAEADLGPPPVPYAWVAFGSEGRMEQLLLTDQDNGIVYAEETRAARSYFQALAEKAVGDLLAAGFPPCPGGYMATKWLGPVEEWTRRVQGWMDGPTPDALLEAAILFDLRRVHGSGPLDRLEEALSRAAKERAFLASLAKAALGFKPPPGLLIRLRGESSRFNIKVQGISPVVALARCYGLEVGSASRNTLHRLRAAVVAGLIGEDVYATLSEAYRFLLRLRLREQIRMAQEGKPVGNVLSLSQLSSIERSQLKDAFRAIESWQEAAAFHYRAGYF